MDCLWGWGMWKEREGLEEDKPPAREIWGGAGLPTALSHWRLGAKVASSPGELGGGAWGFQSRGYVGSEGSRARMSRTWDPGMVGLGWGGLTEATGSLVCTRTYSPASGALFTQLHGPTSMQLRVHGTWGASSTHSPGAHASVCPWWPRACVSSSSLPAQPTTTMSCGSRSRCGMAWCWSPSASSTTWPSATMSFTCGPRSTRH